MKKLFLLILGSAFTGGFSVAAATFTADFNAGTVPAGSSVLGNAAVTATGGVGNTGVLRLTEAVGGQIGTWLINDFSGGAAVNAFNATFKVELGGGTTPPADGFSFAWATNLSGAAFGEEGESGGLVVAFDTFDNSGGEAPAIDVKWNGSVLAHSAVPFNFSAANAAFVTLQITLTNGLVTVIWNGATVHAGIGVAGFTSLSGAKFGFGARTGGFTERHYLDDVSIVTTPGSGSSASFALRAALQTDANANGKASPGDTLRYTISLTNTLGTNLLNAVLTDTSFPNQTFVGGTLTATPLARDESPAANSAPGDAWHGAFNTTLNIAAASGLLTNDFLGLPDATIASWGGGTFGGSVTDHAAGTSALAAGVGTLTVNANGSLTFVPTATFTGPFTFQYRLSNSAGSDDATVTLAIGVRPAAATDAYNVTGNTMMDSSLIPLTVIANDSGSAIGVSGNTAGVNGTVTLGANGHFVFMPNAAFTGAASFTYTITNGFGPATGTVNLTVANKVWYIDNSVGANGDGRSSSPFKQTSDFTTVNDGGAGHPADNDFIFIRQGSGNYTSSATLRAGQKLIGDGSSGTLNTAFGITFASGSAKAAGTALPAFTGTDPVIENTAAGGHGIVLNSGNTVRGLTVGNTPNGYGYSGGAVGTLTISESSKTGTGGAISVGTSGTLAASFDTLSSSSAPAAGINLVGCSGTLTAASGSISAPVGTAVNISGGSATITYPGDITKNNAGRVADIQSRTGGTITLSGNLAQNNASGTGINVSSCSGGTTTFSGASKSLNTGANTAVTLTSNTGHTINFSNGGLVITTTATGFSATGFSATGGGTIGITTGANANTISSGTGTALNVVNSTIGASGLTFQSISSSGGTATGIILDTTGSSGGLTVTGTGSAASGGTIANKTGADGATTTGNGIYLNNCSGISLSWMQLNGFQNFGIKGAAVTGFSLNNSVINGLNGTTEAGGSEEGCLRFDGLFTTGAFAAAQTASILGCTISGSYSDNLRVLNSSGTLNRLMIGNCTFGALNDNGTHGGNNIVITAASGSGATLNFSLTNSLINGARGFQLVATGPGGCHMDAVVRGNRFYNTDVNTLSAGGGVVLQGGDLGLADFTYDVSYNRINTTIPGGAKGAALNIYKASNSTGGSFVGTVKGNQIGVIGTALSGAPNSAPAIWIQSHGAGTYTVLIRDNNIVQYGEEAIDLQATQGSATLNASVFNNTVTPNATNGFAGLNIEQGAVTADTGTNNLVVGSFSVAGDKNDFSNGDPSNFTDIQILRAGSSSTVLNLSKNGSGSGTPTLILQDDNIGGAATSVGDFSPGNRNLVTTLPALPPATAGGSLPAP